MAHIYKYIYVYKIKTRLAIVLKIYMYNTKCNNVYIYIHASLWKSLTIKICIFTIRDDLLFRFKKRRNFFLFFHLFYFISSYYPNISKASDFW